MKEYLKIFVSSFLAGFCIFFGASVFLVCKVQNSFNFTITGAFLFGIGLFSIIQFSLWLYTGKIGFVLDNKLSYLLKLLVCFLGNMIAVVIFPLLVKACNTSLTNQICEAAKTMANAKLSQSWYSCLIMSFMCGVMIYFAVKGHQVCEYPIGKALLVFLPVITFILCGFEHVVANGVYFTYGGVFSFKVVCYFLLMGLGNSLGAIFFDGMLKIIKKLEKKAEEEG